nr:unnamed protein product [Callosobruchus chinensis]
MAIICLTFVSEGEFEIAGSFIDLRNSYCVLANSLNLKMATTKCPGTGPRCRKRNQPGLNTFGTPGDTEMTSKEFLTRLPSWKALQDYYNNCGKDLVIKKLLSEDQGRFEKFSLKLSTPQDGDILIDYSKNRVDSQTMQLLFNLAKECQVEQMRNAMFSGQKINFTEDR